MKIFISVIILMSLISAAAVLSEARSLHPPSSHIMPCEGDFDLTIAIEPAPDNVFVTTISADSTPIGLHIKIERSRGLVSHINGGPIQTVSFARCSYWQQKYWPLVSRILFQNESPGRAHLMCHNIADIRYQLGHEKHHAKVCLADAGQDSLTYGFRRFYEGTERLTW